MSVGLRIKQCREAINMTQGELGALCGTSKQTIFKYESGLVTNIPLSRLGRIATALGVTEAYLMGWDDTQPVEESPLFQRMMEETEQPAVPEWYNELSEEDKVLVQLIINLPSDKKRMLTDLAESWKPPVSEETHGAGQQ